MQIDARFLRIGQYVKLVCEAPEWWIRSRSSLSFFFFVAAECGSDTETTGSRYATAYLWENAVHAISSLIYTDVVIYWREK